MEDNEVKKSFIVKYHWGVRKTKYQWFQMCWICFAYWKYSDSTSRRISLSMIWIIKLLYRGVEYIVQDYTNKRLLKEVLNPGNSCSQYKLLIISYCFINQTHYYYYYTSENDCGKIKLSDHGTNALTTEIRKKYWIFFFLYELLR